MREREREREQLQMDEMEMSGRSHQRRNPRGSGELIDDVFGKGPKLWGSQLCSIFRTPSPLQLYYLS